MKQIIPIIFMVLLVVTPVLSQTKSTPETISMQINPDGKGGFILEYPVKEVIEINQDKISTRVETFSTFYADPNPRVTFGIDPNIPDLLCEYHIMSSNSTVEDMIEIATGIFKPIPPRPTAYAEVFDPWAFESGVHLWFPDCVFPIFPRIDDLSFGIINGDNQIVNTSNLFADGVNTTLSQVSTEKCVSDQFQGGVFASGVIRELINITESHLGVRSSLNGSDVTVTIKVLKNETFLNQTTATFTATNTTGFNLTNFNDIFFTDADLTSNQRAFAEICANATASILPGDGTIFGNLDSLIFDSTQGLKPEIVTLISRNTSNVSSQELMVVSYTGTDSDGFLKTFMINQSGNQTAILDTHEFNTQDTFDTSLVRVSNSITAVAFENLASGIVIETTGYLPDGTITGQLFNLAINFTGVAPFLFRLNESEDIYILLYRDEASTVGVSAVIDIDSLTGSISVIDSMEFNDSATTVKGAVFNDDIISIVFTHVTGVGVQLNLEIFDNNILNRTIKGTFTFDDVLAFFPKIIRNADPTSNITWIVYEDSDGDGQFLSLDNSMDGLIGQIKDQFEYDVDDGHEGELFVVDPEICGIAYTGVDNDGFAKTIGCLKNGTITGTISTFESNSLEAEEIEVVYLFGNIYASVFEDSVDAGITGTNNVSTSISTFPDITFFYNNSDTSTVGHSGFIAGTGFFSSDFNNSIELHGSGEIVIPNITFATPSNLNNINATIDLTPVLEKQDITHSFLNRWELNYTSIGTLFWNNLVTTIQNAFGLGLYNSTGTTFNNSFIENNTIIFNNTVLITNTTQQFIDNITAIFNVTINITDNNTIFDDSAIIKRLDEVNNTSNDTLDLLIGVDQNVTSNFLNLKIDLVSIISSIASIPSDVWSFTTRILTDFSFNVGLNQTAIDDISQERNISHGTGSYVGISDKANETAIIQGVVDGINGSQIVLNATAFDPTNILRERKFIQGLKDTGIIPEDN